MNAEQTYLSLKKRIYTMSMAYSRGNSALQDELLSVADLAFAEALVSFKFGKLTLINWIVLNVQTRMKNFVRSEFRRAKWIKPMPEWAADHFQCHDQIVDDGISLSFDAAAIVEAFTSLPNRTRQAREDAKAALFSLMGWQRYWDAIDEIKLAFGG
jgi:hypothetical protein